MFVRIRGVVVDSYEIADGYRLEALTLLRWLRVRCAGSDPCTPRSALPRRSLESRRQKLLRFSL